MNPRKYKEGTHNIVIGQNVTSAKRQRAKELRQNMSNYIIFIHCGNNIRTDVTGTEIELTNSKILVF